jgi:subtilisin family serine protease
MIAALPLQGQNRIQTQRGKLRKVERAIPNQYIVVLNEEAVVGNVPSIAAEVAYAHGGAIRFIYEHALQGFSIELPEAAALMISRDPRVKYVEENAMGEVAATQNNPPWGLDRIDQRDGRNSTYNYLISGGGVNVYVLDTGIRASHNDFGGRASQVANFINETCGGDCNGHGTHVAGTIGGSTYGVAKNVTLQAVKVCNSGGNCPTDVVTNGINWVTANAAKPAVANMSLRFEGDVATINDAVKRSIGTGITYVVAAGNENRVAANYSPARVTEAITVGATDGGDYRYGNSNFGLSVDIFAPGVEVLSAGIGSDSATAIMTGTSMAAPHVAGVAALYLHSRPTAPPAEVSRAITYNASFAKVRNSERESANRLLYSGFDMSRAYPDPLDVPLYRFSATNPTRHFYTTNYAESVNAPGYIYNGVQCYVYSSQVAGTVPLYRFHALNPVRYFYTTNWNEGAGLAGYTYNGPAGYIFPSQASGTMPLYRFHALNPLRHFYTTNWNEGASATEFAYDGPQGYVYMWW